MSAGACCYFRTSKPHSGTLCITLSAEDSLQRPYESVPTVHLPSRVSEVSVGPLLGGHEVQRHQDRGGHLGTVSEECERAA